MLAAKLSKIANPSHISQLDNGPAENRKDAVQPRLLLKLQAAKAYAEKTAGPIRSESSAANRWAKLPAQLPVPFKIPVVACQSPPAHGREGSVCTATAVVLVSDINLDPAIISDARQGP